MYQPLVKNLPANAGDAGSIPESERSQQRLRSATHFNIFAWEIPCTEDPDGLQSMESQRVGYDWATKQQQSTFLKSTLQRNCSTLMWTETFLTCALYPDSLTASRQGWNWVSTSLCQKRDLNILPERCLDKWVGFYRGQYLCGRKNIGKEKFKKNPDRMVSSME